MEPSFWKGSVGSCSASNYGDLVRSQVLPFCELLSLLQCSCCGTLLFEPPPPLFPLRHAFGTFTCLIEFRRFRRTMADIKIATLPAEMVPSGFGSFVSAGPGAIWYDAVMVSVGNLVTTRARQLIVVHLPSSRVCRSAGSVQKWHPARRCRIQRKVATWSWQRVSQIQRVGAFSVVLVYLRL